MTNGVTSPADLHCRLIFTNAEFSPENQKKQIAQGMGPIWHRSCLMRLTGSKHKQSATFSDILISSLLQ